MGRDSLCVLLYFGGECPLDVSINFKLGSLESSCELQAMDSRGCSAWGFNSSAGFRSGCVSLENLLYYRGNKSRQLPQCVGLASISKVLARDCHHRHIEDSKILRILLSHTHHPQCISVMFPTNDIKNVIGCRSCLVKLL